MDEEELKKFVENNDTAREALKIIVSDSTAMERLKDLMGVPLGMATDKLNEIVTEFIDSPACDAMEDWEKLKNKNAIKDITGGVILVARGMQDLSLVVSDTLMDSAFKAMTQMFIGLGDTPGYQQAMEKVMNELMASINPKNEGEGKQ